MICASCGAEVESAVGCPCGDTPLLRGRYRLEEVLGRGAAGRTYRAADLETGAEVAVKELLLREAQDLDAVERFGREGAILALLDHPKVAKPLESFRWGTGRSTGLYLVRELVVGEPLDREARGRRFGVVEALEVMAELLETLGALHGRVPPVLHRDVKPSNVIRRASDRALVLIDFGAGKELGRWATSTESALVGTYGYMAPERFAGQSHRGSDTYAVAVLGLVLMNDLAPEEAAGSVLGRLPHRRLRMPRALRRLFVDMLEPDLDRRHSHAAELARRCRRIASAANPRQFVVLRPGRPKGRNGRGVAVATLVASIVGVAALGATSAMMPAARESTRAATEPPPAEAEATAGPTGVPPIPDGSACEREGACRGLATGLGGFVVDREGCPSQREVLESLRSGARRTTREVEVTLAGRPWRCFAYSWGATPCSLRCDMGIGQRDGGSYRLGELRERRAAVVQELRDTFGREGTHLDHDSGQGFGRQMSWTWREEGFVLQLTQIESEGDDAEARPTTPGSVTALTLRYDAIGRAFP